MTESRGIQIFLAHASDDRAAVLELYERLQERGYSPWLDKKNLIAGQNWRTEISRAIKSSDIVIACLSHQSVNKSGYVQKELRQALMEYGSKPPDSIYLIPLKLEACEVPDVEHSDMGVRLRDLHWLDYWESDGFTELLRAIEHGRKSSSSVPSSSMPAPSNSSEDKHQRFRFEVVTVDARGQETDRRQESAEHFLEDLGNGVTLDMVRIPGGEFMMGSPANELERQGSEGPQHRVQVSEFFMGRYPVTQAQWHAVAALERVNRELKIDPSWFKGVHRPVERVSWKDALEYCDRLTCLTGHHYSLPSEAQWEYACRARTTTPFHFGLTLTSEIANYWAEYTYGEGSKGEYRNQTTDVGHFPANVFGLHDMHGNILEWCQDHWYSNYANAPVEGKAWLGKKDDDYHVLRGGSWAYTPRKCRSACRKDFAHDLINDYIGFRVACAFPRSL